MNKKELIAKICETLYQNDIRKPISIKSEKFVISNEGGDSATFSTNRMDRRLMYTAVDVCNILDAAIAVVEDCMRRGEPVGIRGFGALHLKKTKEHMVREPDQEIWHTIPSQYKPKFVAGSGLAAAARSFGLQEDEVTAEQFFPEPDEEEEI